jgi:hypothetical protein
MYVGQLPIPQPSNEERSAISALVQKCLRENGDSIAHIETELNGRVARLYRLTRDEQKFIAESTEM